MGRVRRYKKYKACDPNSKQYGKPKDTKYDEPPEIFEKKSKKLNTDREAKWDDEEKRERMLQREALRDLRQTAAKDALKEKTIEPKREDESMQEFKARIKKETRKTLAEEITKMTATAVKRKLRLKERSQKRKAKKGGNKGDDDRDDQVQDFYSAENGHLRPSDLGESRTSFRPTEEVAFGAAPERPPDLNSFTTKFRVTNAAKTQSHSEVQQRGAQSDDEDEAEGSENEENEEEESEVEEEVYLTKNQRNKKRKALALSRNNMDGDDGLDSVHLPAELPIQLKRQNTASSNTSSTGTGSAGKKDKYGILIDTGVKASKVGAAKNSNKEGTKDFGEMEKLRAKVQEAYKLLKEKRRLEG